MGNCYSNHLEKCMICDKYIKETEVAIQNSCCDIIIHRHCKMYDVKCPNCNMVTTKPIKYSNVVTI